LFLANTSKSKPKDPFNSANLHVAVWHEDLLDLSDAGYISGVARSTERRWEYRRRLDLWAPTGDVIHLQLPDGTLQKVDLPALETYDDDYADWPEFIDDGIVVTSSGWQYVTRLLAAAPDPFSVIGESARRIFEIGEYSAAIREVCVSIEHQLKAFVGSSQNGWRLIEEVINHVRKRQTIAESHLKVLRCQLRTAFTFIRNEYAHRLVGVTEVECRSLIFRLARLKTTVDRIVEDTQN
jgi:hypothetical protein